MIEIDKNIFKILNIIYLSQLLVKSKLHKLLIKILIILFTYFIYIYIYKI